MNTPSGRARAGRCSARSRRLGLAIGAAGPLLPLVRDRHRDVPRGPAAGPGVHGRDDAGSPGPRAPGGLRLTVTKVVLLGLAVLAHGAPLLGWLEPVVGAARRRPVRPGSSTAGSRACSTATPVTERPRPLLAFAVGVLAGAVIRRVVPAMAATAVATHHGVLSSPTTGCTTGCSAWGCTRAQDPALAANPNVGFQAATAGRPARVAAWVPGPAGGWLDQGWYAGPGGHRLSGTLSRAS